MDIYDESNDSSAWFAPRWLKSPDVRYTQPLEVSTAAQSMDAQIALTATDDECVHPAIVDGLRAQVADLERKLRELQLRGVAYESNVSSRSVTIE